MSDADLIRGLWEYMVFADRQIIAAAKTVPRETEDRDYDISAGSVRRLLAHAFNAQRLWLAHLTGRTRPAPMAVTCGDCDALWAPVHEELLSFARAQDSLSLQRLVRSADRAGNPFELPLWLCMVHVCDHATYHRGQLNSLIKLAGGKPSPVMVFSWGKQRHTSG